jgi:hypothetical protein
MKTTGPLKLAVVTEHDQMLPLIAEVAETRGSDFRFVNVDSHSDMDMFKGELNIGNFITRAIGLGYLSDCLWIKNDHNTDFDDGKYSFQLWDSTKDFPFDNFYECNFEHVCYFLNGTYNRIVGRDATNVTFEVVSENNLHRLELNRKPWLLSIDCDYFSSANPFKLQLQEIIQRVGEDKSRDADEYFSQIKTFDEWVAFLQWLSWEELVPDFMEAIHYVQPEYVCSDEEIEHKTSVLFERIKSEFDLSQCHGVFICESSHSGFLAPGRLPIIARTLNEKILNTFGDFL